MMATMTSSDCYAEARLKATIITCQRKLGRFLQRIAEKESYAALYKSKFMCERYDEEIEELYTKVAELEGDVYKRQTSAMFCCRRRIAPR